MLILDKYGFPVQHQRGRPIQNVLRNIIHGSIWQTLTKQQDWIKSGEGWRYRNEEMSKTVTMSPKEPK